MDIESNAVLRLFKSRVKELRRKLLDVSNILQTRLEDLIEDENENSSSRDRDEGRLLGFERRHQECEARFEKLVSLLESRYEELGGSSSILNDIQLRDERDDRFVNGWDDENLAEKPPHMSLAKFNALMSLNKQECIKKLNKCLTRLENKLLQYEQNPFDGLDEIRAQGIEEDDDNSNFEAANSQGENALINNNSNNSFDLDDDELVDAWKKRKRIDILSQLQPRQQYVPRERKYTDTVYKSVKKFKKTLLFHYVALIVSLRNWLLSKSQEARGISLAKIDSLIHDLEGNFESYMSSLNRSSRLIANSKPSEEMAVYHVQPPKYHKSSNQSLYSLSSLDDMLAEVQDFLKSFYHSLPSDLNVREEVETIIRDVLEHDDLTFIQEKVDKLMGLINEETRLLSTAAYEYEHGGDVFEQNQFKRQRHAREDISRSSNRSSEQIIDLSTGFNPSPQYWQVSHRSKKMMKMWSEHPESGDANPDLNDLTNDIAENHFVSKLGIEDIPILNHLENENDTLYKLWTPYFSKGYAPVLPSSATTSSYTANDIAYQFRAIFECMESASLFPSSLPSQEKISVAKRSLRAIHNHCLTLNKGNIVILNMLLRDTIIPNMIQVLCQCTLVNFCAIQRACNGLHGYNVLVLEFYWFLLEWLDFVDFNDMYGNCCLLIFYDLILLMQQSNGDFLVFAHDILFASTGDKSNAFSKYPPISVWIKLVKYIDNKFPSEHNFWSIYNAFAIHILQLSHDNGFKLLWRDSNLRFFAVSIKTKLFDPTIWIKSILNSHNDSTMNNEECIISKFERNELIWELLMRLAEIFEIFKFQMLKENKNATNYERGQWEIVERIMKNSLDMFNENKSDRERIVNIFSKYPWRNDNGIGFMLGFNDNYKSDYPTILMKRLIFISHLWKGTQCTHGGVYSSSFALFEVFFISDDKGNFRGSGITEDNPFSFLSQSSYEEILKGKSMFLCAKLIAKFSYDHIQISSSKQQQIRIISAVLNGIEDYMALQSFSKVSCQVSPVVTSSKLGTQMKNPDTKNLSIISLFALLASLVSISNSSYFITQISRVLKLLKHFDIGNFSHPSSKALILKSLLCVYEVSSKDYHFQSIQTMFLIVQDVFTSTLEVYLDATKQLRDDTEMRISWIRISRKNLASKRKLLRKGMNKSVNDKEKNDTLFIAEKSQSGLLSKQERMSLMNDQSRYHQIISLCLDYALCRSLFKNPDSQFSIYRIDILKNQMLMTKSLLSIVLEPHIFSQLKEFNDSLYILILNFISTYFKLLTKGFPDYVISPGELRKQIMDEDMDDYLNVLTEHTEMSYLRKAFDNQLSTFVDQTKNIVKDAIVFEDMLMLISSLSTVLADTFKRMDEAKSDDVDIVDEVQALHSVGNKMSTLEAYANAIFAKVYISNAQSMQDRSSNLSSSSTTSSASLFVFNNMREIIRLSLSAFPKNNLSLTGRNIDSLDAKLLDIYQYRRLYPAKFLSILLQRCILFGVKIDSSFITNCFESFVTLLFVPMHLSEKVNWIEYSQILDIYFSYYHGHSDKFLEFVVSVMQNVAKMTKGILNVSYSENKLAIRTLIEKWHSFAKVQNNLTVEFTNRFFIHLPEVIFEQLVFMQDQAKETRIKFSEFAFDGLSILIEEYGMNLYSLVDPLHSTFHQIFYKLLFPKVINESYNEDLKKEWSDYVVSTQQRLVFVSIKCILSQLLPKMRHDKLLSKWFKDLLILLYEINQRKEMPNSSSNHIDLTSNIDFISELVNFINQSQIAQEMLTDILLSNENSSAPPFWLSFLNTNVHSSYQFKCFKQMILSTTEFPSSNLSILGDFESRFA